mmetsp:Transcript_74796/g.206226  ORF Transcript_74796/g.206226 Transcript_74796/m.206226 type:complete len:228 (+) Transcript_74796:244-927(+)
MMPSFFAADLSAMSSCAQLFSQTPAKPWPCFPGPPKAVSHISSPLMPSSSAAFRSSCASRTQDRSHAAPGTQAAASQASAPATPKTTAARRSPSESCAQVRSQAPPVSRRSCCHDEQLLQAPAPSIPRVLAAARCASASSAHVLPHALSAGSATLRHAASSKPNVCAAERCHSVRLPHSTLKTAAVRSSQPSAVSTPSCLAASASGSVSAAHTFSLASNARRNMLSA